MAILWLSISACALPPAGRQKVQLASRDFGFVDELFLAESGQSREIDGSLFLPDPKEFAGPYPALILLHTSYGQGSQDWFYAERFLRLGIAVLAVDSFSARGVEKTVLDQTVVSGASLLADAFAALGFLREDSRIDSQRIGIMGFSKGGIAAVYAAYEPIRSRLAPNGNAFALHLAYYPWCGIALDEPVTTGAPVLIQTGALDDLLPAALCQQLIASSRGPGGSANIEIVVQEGARHAFDHPLLSIFGRLPVGGTVPTHCLFQQESNGRFRERHTGLLVNAENARKVLDLCSTEAGSAGGNSEASERAFARSVAFLRDAGFIVVTE